jgi:dephospho-CoA kinase
VNVVGLTGGIATGKSTVARWLSAHGVLVVDADLVAREVVAPGTDGFSAVAQRFPEVVTTGTLDRAALRRTIASDPAARRDLDAITHPRIYAGMRARLDVAEAAGRTLAVVEAALMVETGSYRGYAAVIVVTCRPETQLRRLIERDRVSEDEARRLIATQMPLAEKEKAATDLIRNDGTLAELEAETARVWAAVVARLADAQAKR